MPVFIADNLIQMPDQKKKFRAKKKLTNQFPAFYILRGIFIEADMNQQKTVKNEYSHHPIYNYPMFVERLVSYSQCKQMMMSLRGQASSAKMISLGGKLTAPVCHLTKRVNNAE